MTFASKLVSKLVRGLRIGLRSARRFAVLAALAALLVAALPGTSHAGAKTLTRSLQNLILFPLDIALSPFVATKTTWDNWTSSGDTTAVKWGYAPIAPIWATGVSVGASIIRGLAGALELLPGIVLLPFDAEMSPIYDLPQTQPAWVDQELGPVQIRFGVNYVSSSG